MLRFAWWSLRGRWERILTLCLGLICISICTTFLAGLTHLSTLTADQQVSRAWHTPYDLLVRAPAALSSAERQLQMVDPSAPEQTYGGISLKQANIIAHIPHVAVVAPEVVVGWVVLRPYVQITFTKPGLYRVTSDLVEQCSPLSSGESSARNKGGGLSLPCGLTRLQSLFEVLPLAAYKGAMQSTTKLTYVPLDAAGTATVSAYWSLPTLLVGIDPAAEGSVVGLHWQPEPKSTAAGGLPLLMDTHAWAPLTATVTAERASLPMPFTMTADGGDDRLSTASWALSKRQQYDGGGLLTLLAHELGGQEPQASTVPLQGGGVTRYARAGYGSVQADSADSMQPVIKLLSAGSDSSGSLTRLSLLPQATDPWVTFGNKGTFATFDAARLPISSDSGSLSVPLGLYRPEPGVAAPQLFPQRSIVSWPPLLFTTVNAACALVGEQCISTLRVRVSGPSSFGQRSEALLQQVAADIEERTGLHVDVLTGASGRQVTVQVPDSKNAPSTITESWIQPHAAITIANGVNGANVLLLLAEVSIAALALVAAALLFANSRRSEIEVLLRIGWSYRQILLEALVEAAMTALLAALPAWAIALLSGRLGAPAILPAAVLCALGSAALLYMTIVVGATRTILAGHGRSATWRPRVRGQGTWWWLMLLRQVAWHKGSSSLVVVSTASACALVSFMLLIYRGLDGLLYSTLLGQRVQVSLSGIHVITAALTCASAALAVGLVLLLMVRERRREFGMLLAIGWAGRTVAGEIVREGMALGFLGGLCGGAVAVLIFVGGYHTWSPLLFAGCLAGAALSGTVLCTLAALYPAFLAARFAPRQVLAGD